MGEIGVVFAGQGTQHPGMGQSLYEGSRAAREIFDRAEAVRPGTREQCFQGSQEELNQTRNAQPCLYTVELAAFAALREGGVVPQRLAGFSLGELSALCASGAVGFEEGLRLVMERGRLMDEAAGQADSGMVAVVKLDNAAVEALCARFDRVYPVNYNCPGQVAVAGLTASLEPFKAAVKEAGGRALPLKVSGGFHSPFMAQAGKKFGAALGEADIAAPELPLYSNVTGLPYAGEMKELLERQISSPVRWSQILEHMAGQGTDTFIEVGPGKTLCGFVGKTLGEARALHVEDMESLARTLEEVKA